jgi:hypothetical protein
MFDLVDAASHNSRLKMQENSPHCFLACTLYGKIAGPKIRISVGEPKRRRATNLYSPLEGEPLVPKYENVGAIWWSIMRGRPSLSPELQLIRCDCTFQAHSIARVHNMSVGPAYEGCCLEEFRVDETEYIGWAIRVSGICISI